MKQLIQIFVLLFGLSTATLAGERSEMFRSLPSLSSRTVFRGRLMHGGLMHGGT